MILSVGKSSFISTKSDLIFKYNFFKPRVRRIIIIAPQPGRKNRFENMLKTYYVSTYVTTITLRFIYIYIEMLVLASQFFFHYNLSIS